MSNQCVNIYKTGRVNAGLTQEQAAQLLNIAQRTLSDYENGKAKVPDDIVGAMSERYNAPLLAWKHLKENSVLGKFLPNVVLPRTNGDMAFQAIISQDDLKPIVSEIKRIMADGVISEDEQESFEQQIELLKSINAKLMSIIIYAGKSL